MSQPSSDKIKEWAEKTEAFVGWLAGVCLQKSWVRKLIVLNIFFLVFLNPATSSFVLKVLLGDSSLPEWYPVVFWLVLSTGFVAAFILAVREQSRQSKEPGEAFSERSIVKGLLAYEAEDAELFAKLQRHEILKECLGAITSSDFRFGILCGESGVGKTSFLQAGIWPALAKLDYRCVYVRLTDEDPLDVIRLSLLDQTDLPAERIQDADFASVLKALAASDGKPTLIILDQFEQFFRRRARDRRRLIDGLTDWYRTHNDVRVKIFISLRGDFVDRLIELQKAMRYSLGPQETFRLERFEPEQAALVFTTIADLEGVPYDEKFVEQLVQEELASHDDGLVSPVDVQVLSWMIVGQKSSDQRAFDRSAYQKLGGVEGLLERFLERALAARETKTRRQRAVKVLLALSDLECDTRAGTKTLPQLQRELKDVAKKSEIEETVQWLSRGDVRLIHPIERDEKTAYELAHERLIPALRRLAEKESSDVVRVNKLLARRVNEWLGNDRSPRYLLTFREWRLIGRHFRFVSWGSQGRQKRELLAETRKRFKSRLAIAILLFLLTSCSLAGYLVWRQSTARQISMFRSDLVHIREKISDEDVLKQIAVDYAFVGDFDECNNTIEKIDTLSFRASTMGTVAEELGKRGKWQQATIYLQRMLSAAENSSEGFSDVADVAEKLATMSGDASYYRYAVDALQMEEDDYYRDYRDYYLPFIADHAMDLAQSTKDKVALRHAFEAVEGITNSSEKAERIDELLGKAADLYSLTCDGEILDEAIQFATRIDEPSEKMDALRLLQKAATGLGVTRQDAAFLEQGFQVAMKIEEPRERLSCICELSRAAAQIDRNDAAVEYFKEAEKLAEKEKGGACDLIAGAASRLAEATENARYLQIAREAAGQVEEPVRRVSLFTEMARSAARIDKRADADDFFNQALEAAITIDNANSFVDNQIIQTATTLAETWNDYAFLEKVVHKHRAWFVGMNSEADLLNAVAVSAAKIGESDIARICLMDQIGCCYRITDVSERRSAFKSAARCAAELAMALPDSNQLSHALEAVLASGDYCAFEIIERAVVQLVNATGDTTYLQTAIDVAENTRDGSAMQHATRVAEELAKAKKDIASLQQIEPVVERIEEKSLKQRPFFTLARAAASLRKKDLAIRYLQQSLDAAQNPADERSARLQWQVEKTLDLAETTKDRDYLEKAFEAVRSMEVGYPRSRFWNDAVDCAARLSELTKDATFLQRAFSAAEEMDQPDMQMLAEATARICQSTRNPVYLQQLSDIADRFRGTASENGYWFCVVESAASLVESTGNPDHLEHARRASQQIQKTALFDQRPRALQRVAIAAAGLAVATEDNKYLQDAVDAARESDRTEAWREVMKAATRLTEKTENVVFLRQALYAAESSRNASALRDLWQAAAKLAQRNKDLCYLASPLRDAKWFEFARDEAYHLNDIVDSATILAEATKDPLYLERAMDAAERIKNPEDKTKAFRRIAASCARQELWKEAREAVERNTYEAGKALAISAILRACAEQN